MKHVSMVATVRDGLMKKRSGNFVGSILRCSRLDKAQDLCKTVVMSYAKHTGKMDLKPGRRFDNLQR